MKHSSQKIDPSEPPSPQALLAIARECLPRSYSPYSAFPVAAAVVDDDGRIFTGVNVENASYGLTMCAERVAIFNAIAAGAKKLRALALTSDSSRAVMPCGACRQVLAEFGEMAVESWGTGGAVARWSVAELLPGQFELPGRERAS